MSKFNIIYFVFVYLKKYINLKKEYNVSNRRNIIFTRNGYKQEHSNFLL